MRRILNKEGEVVNDELEPEIPDEELWKWYETMTTLRILDEKAMRLQRQGRISFHIPIKGQEAHVGAAAALNKEDWIYPAYREHGCALYRGFTLERLMHHLFANRKDPEKGRRLPGVFGDPDINFVNPSAPVGTQVIHAAGIGYAMQYLNEEKVSIVFFGDGATSSNGFHAGMNFGGAFQTPTVFICQNNRYAISLPVSEQTGANELVDKAPGYGMPGIAIDGNDVLAMYVTVKEAAERARKGEGPTFIESRTYRLGAHTSSDDPTRYRTEEEVEKWKTRDPIKRFRTYLFDKEVISKNKDDKLREKINEKLKQLTKKAEEVPKPPLKTLFTDVYAEMPWHLEEQFEYAQKIEEKEKGGKKWQKKGQW